MRWPSAPAMRAELIKDPVAAVAKGRVMNYLQEVEEGTQQTNSHLTEIMMAQDFHDLTGQVIARVVALAADLNRSCWSC
jgi:chemotaxis protein CheZ